VATKLGTVLADFTTQLATAMAIGATSVSLQSATDDDGYALPAGVYFFAIDGNNSQKEHIVCTLSGTSLTGISSVSRQGVQTSGVVRAHRVGATVTLTDFAHLRYINDLISGATQLDADNPLEYDGTASITDPNQIATKAYVDGVAIAGAPDASTTTKGIAKLSVNPVSPTLPIAVGDNDTRLPTSAQVGYIPTSGQKDALAATTTPGSGNLFITQKDFQKAAEVYVVTTGSANAYVATYSPAPSALVAGMRFTFKANFANTGACTLNPNSLGATTIKKNGSSDLAANDILNGQIVQVEYDGTNFQLLSPPSSAFLGKIASAADSKNAADASTTQHIAHGLGVVPKFVKITAMCFSDGIAMISQTTYTNGAQSSVSLSANPNVSSTLEVDAAFILNAGTTGSAGQQTGVVTVDATNINIAWTKASSPSGSYLLLWEALA
jgi:hypothetical protein